MVSSDLISMRISSLSPSGLAFFMFSYNVKVTCASKSDMAQAPAILSEVGVAYEPV